MDGFLLMVGQWVIVGRCYCRLELTVSLSGGLVTTGFVTFEVRDTRKWNTQAIASSMVLEDSGCDSGLSGLGLSGLAVLVECTMLHRLFQETISTTS